MVFSLYAVHFHYPLRLSGGTDCANIRVVCVRAPSATVYRRVKNQLSSSCFACTCLQSQYPLNGTNDADNGLGDVGENVCQRRQVRGVRHATAGLWRPQLFLAPVVCVNTNTDRAEPIDVYHSPTTTGWTFTFVVCACFRFV